MPKLPGICRLDHKLHPRTGFMIFFPGFCIIAIYAYGFLSGSPYMSEALKGLPVGVGIVLLTAIFSFWGNRGHFVSWDAERVFVRQPDATILFQRYPIAVVPFTDIRGFNFLPPPRGVPPAFPLLELDAPGHENGPPLTIDANYFTAMSLMAFVEELANRRPEMLEGKQGKAVANLLRILERRAGSRR